jgi:hypothetical protein
VDRVVVVARSTSTAGAGLAEVQKLLAGGAVGADQVLWLAGKEDLPVPASVVLRPREYPISLREVEEFVGVTGGVVAAAA